MFIYQLKLKMDKLPLNYDYYSNFIISAESEEDARQMAHKKSSFRGDENRFNLELIKELYEKIDDFSVPGAQEKYYALRKINWYSDEYDNEIWKNPEFTEIKKIGTSDSTEVKIHCCSFHAG